MTRERKSKKVKYSTVSLPRRLADDIQEIIDECGYWPSLSAFVRDAALEKLRREKQSPGKIVEEPPIAFSPKKLREAKEQ